MRKAFFLALASTSISPIFSVHTEELKTPAETEISQKPFTSFTGKVTRNKVRMRNKPSLEGQIIRELSKGDMLIVVGETDDFYAILPPADVKAYVFRTFVLDNQIEGNHVNVRISPDLDAPVIAQLNSGDKIDGSISSQNSKWFEISPPVSAKFYICKDYLEKIGDEHLMAAIAKRRKEVNDLLQTSYQASQEELQKPFPEISLDGLLKNYQLIVDDYSDFPDQAGRAKELAAQLQEQYLSKKIAYLEAKAAENGALAKKSEEAIPSQDASLAKEEIEEAIPYTSLESEVQNPWLSKERSIYEAWANTNGGGSFDDFYTAQKNGAVVLQGVLESYKRPLKNRPGDYMLVSKVSSLPIAYLYSTRVNLEEQLGSNVTLVAVERPNNYYAYPAYFVISLD